MLAFIATPAVALLVLGVLLVEAVVLLILWRTRGQGLRPGEIATFLGAGAAFAICLYAALADLGPMWVAAPLIVAFLCHVADLRHRWRD
ncbi:MAG: hypothetical protein AAFO70_01625 [Pseudomonadota bacterium]